MSHPTPDTWAAASADLRAQLEASYKREGAHCFSSNDFQGWFDHLRWIALGLDNPSEWADPAHLKTFVALGHDSSVSHLLVEKMSPADAKDKALEILLQLSEANAADLHEYAALGVAYSLVFDVPFPDNWPHHQVARAAVPIGDTDPVARFNFYVQANRDHHLELDPSRLSFENLKYLVDSEVKLSELAFAQKNRLSYSQFSDAYFSIQYATSRISGAQTQYDWTGDSYCLADIEHAGGICIDQAYYAAILGKGRGIPTIRFSGFGMDGAHAWMGYLSNSGKWELDVGRYEQQDFPKGFAVDPQTWASIDDATLQNLFKNGAKNPSFQPAMAALAWASLHEGQPAYPKMLDEARDLMPEWSGTWRLQADLVDKSGDARKIKSFYDDWLRQFSTYPDMKVEGQKRLYHVLKAANDPDADGVLKDIILQNRTEGFDLGIEAGADALSEKIKANDWDGARQIFERTVKDFANQGGLTLYTKIVRPYIHACLEAHKADAADHAVRFVQDYMPIDSTSQLGQIFGDLKEEVAKQKADNR